jgi:NAD(P)-dependent dehydrogenase (short-subunit alcohol dehydrogenase family)
VKNTVDHFGRLDAVITTAGIVRSAPIHETSDELWEEVLSVNLGGVFRVCRAALPHLMAAGGGSIVNLSSVHAEATFAGTGAYAASKGAIISLSRQIAVEYADFGIRCNALVVGGVQTKMSDTHLELISRDAIKIHPPEGALGRAARPTEIASAVRFLCSSDSSFVTGSAMRIDGGLLSHLM